jgi:hypothetical protein
MIYVFAAPIEIAWLVFDYIEFRNLLSLRLVETKAEWYLKGYLLAKTKYALANRYQFSIAHPCYCFDSGNRLDGWYNRDSCDDFTIDRNFNVLKLIRHIDHYSNEIAVFNVSIHYIDDDTDDDYYHGNEGFSNVMLIEIDYHHVSGISANICLYYDKRRNKWHFDSEHVSVYYNGSLIGCGPFTSTCVEMPTEIQMSIDRYLKVAIYPSSISHLQMGDDGFIRLRGNVIKHDNTGESQMTLSGCYSVKPRRMGFDSSVDRNKCTLKGGIVVYERLVTYEFSEEMFRKQNSNFAINIPNVQGIYILGMDTEEQANRCGSEGPREYARAIAKSLCKGVTVGLSHLAEKHDLSEWFKECDPDDALEFMNKWNHAMFAPKRSVRERYEKSWRH